MTNVNIAIVCARRTAVDRSLKRLIEESVGGGELRGWILRRGVYTLRTNVKRGCDQTGPLGPPPSDP